MQFNMNNELYLQTQRLCLMNKQLHSLKQQIHNSQNKMGAISGIQKGFGINDDAALRRNSILHNKYIVTNRIGRGTFGDIWAVRDKAEPNKKYAIKMVRADKLKCLRYSAAFMSEGKKLINLNAIETKENGKQFIIKCREILCSNKALNHLNEPLNPMIVMELCGYSLSEYIQRNVSDNSDIIPFETIRFISAQLLSAMTFLHGVGAMVHADLKPENILIHYNDTSPNQLYPRIKIADFGNAMPLNEKLKVNSKPFNIQTISYRAPEILCGNVDDISCLIDIWSIGCILCEFMNKKLLHHEPGNSVEKVIHQIHKTVEPLPIYLYNKFKSMNHQNEINDKSKIMSYNQLKNNRKYKLMAKYNDVIKVNESQLTEFESFMDFIVCLLDVNPLTRYSSEDALKHRFIIKDFVFKKKVTHPIIKSSNDDERQSRINKQIQKYEALVNTQSQLDLPNYKTLTGLIIRQHLSIDYSRSCCI